MCVQEKQSGRKIIQAFHSTENVVVLGSLHFSKTYFQHQSSGNTEEGQLSLKVVDILYRSIKISKD